MAGSLRSEIHQGGLVGSILDLDYNEGVGHIHVFSLKHL